MADIDVLSLWEAVSGPPAGLAGRLLAAAGEREPGALPLGRAAARLAALRDDLLGPPAEALADCPSCGERVAFALPFADLRRVEPPPPRLTVEVAGTEVTVRLPTLDDLAAVSGCPDVAAGAEALLRRLVVAATRAGSPVAPEALPPSVIAAIEEAIDRADALADARVALRCPSCAATWSAGLDLAGFVAAEVAAAARRLLSEIAALARAYGWSEAEILAMSPARRRAYLALA